MAIEVVAFPPEDLAKMRADTIGKTGLNRSGRTSRRPFFAFGKVKKMVGGGSEYAWYPKCQLIENTDETKTREESFEEQNDTLTIRAYAFDSTGKIIKNSVDSSSAHYPEGLTEDSFFNAPIITKEDLAKAATP